MRSYYKTLFTAAALTLALLVVYTCSRSRAVGLDGARPDTKRTCPTDGGPGR